MIENPSLGRVEASPLYLEKVLREKETSLSSKMGTPFSQPVAGVVDERLVTPGIESNYWLHGTIDYETRVVKINSEAIAGSQMTVEDVIEHELLHILERDYLGSGPFYNHLTHAVLDDKEGPRMLEVATTILNHPDVQNYLWGIQQNFDIQYEKGNLSQAISLLEAIATKRGRDISEGRNAEQYQGFLSMALHQIKLAYFSLLFRDVSPKAALEFEKGLQGLPASTLNKAKVYSFSNEQKLAESILEKYQRGGN